MKEVTITPKEIEGCINDLLDAKENYKIAYENVIAANKMLEKKLDEITQYACDLEDKICYLNGDWNKLKECIQEKYWEKIDYQAKIRRSDLQQGDYPVSYYYAEQSEKLCNYFLNRMKDIKEEHND